MKAKKVYEFRTSGEIISMGNDVLLKKQFEKLYYKYYDTQIIFEIKNNIIYLNKDLFFESLDIFEFPFKIHNTNLIDLSDNTFNKFTNYLYASGGLFLSNVKGPGIKTLGSNIFAGNELNIESSDVEFIHKDIVKPDPETKIGGIYAKGSKLKELPEELGSIEFPLNYIDISYTSIKQLPENINVKEIEMNNTNMDEQDFYYFLKNKPKTFNVNKIRYNKQYWYLKK